jgi:site-specific DNA-methyltransferase (adenine-specific)
MLGRASHHLAVRGSATIKFCCHAFRRNGQSCPTDRESGECRYRQLKEQRDKPVQQLRRKKVAGRMVNARDDSGNIMYQTKEDRTIDNVWRIPCIQPADKTQRMGYPTQKPLKLLERVIEASCPPEGVVLDPFCGCGTAIVAAQSLGRQWVGIDVTHLAIGLIKYRLLHSFGLKPKVDYAVVGEPTTIQGAQQLATDNERHQFEHWALGIVGARASAKGPGADKGMDGQLSFQEGGTGSPHQRIIISVKSGKVSSRDVRDLVGAVQREKAAMGWLITLEPATTPMKTEAANHNVYESPWGRHPKIQVMTVADLLDGQKFDMPPIRPGGTTLQLPLRIDPKGRQPKLNI